MKKLITPVLLLSLSLSSIFPMQHTQAATKLSLSKTKITMTVGTNKTVKANKKVTWKSSDKKVATVKKLTASKATISAKKAGSCKITATDGKKKATIRVTIKKAVKTEIAKPSTGVTPTVTSTVTEVSGSTTISTTAPTAPNDKTNTTSVPESTSTAAANGSVQIGQVSTKLINVTKEKVTFSLVNETGYQAILGHAFSLEKLENGQWIFVKPAVPVSFTLEGLLLPNGENYTESVNLTAYAPLENGIYRVVKEIYVIAPSEAETDKTPSITTYVEFSINENIGEQPASATPASPNTTPVYTTMQPTEQPIATTPVVVSQAGVTMTFESYKDGNLSYILANESGNTITYGCDYFILKEIDGIWVYVEPSRIPIMPDVLFILSNGNSRVYTENTKEIYDLQPGNYCMVKTFFYETYNSSSIQPQLQLALPFEVS